MGDLDADLREAQEWYSGLADDDPVKYDFEAFVYMTLSHAARRRADQYRAAEARRSRRER